MLVAVEQDSIEEFQKVAEKFNLTDIVEKPIAYVIPQGWWSVIDLLKLNEVKMIRLKKDSIVKVSAYHIDSYKSFPKAYEKHHKNYDVSISKKEENIKFLNGDYIITLNQPSNRYLVETLEPTGDDGFFSWNFFDAILQEKEGYSDYRWDSLAEQILKKDNILRQNFQQKKLSDTLFSKNADAQLNYIYKNSAWYEREHLRYPVYRIEK